MLHKKIYVSVILILCWFTFLSTPASSQNAKGIYVDNFYTVIQNKTEQIKLLEMAKSLNINYLLLYDVVEVDDRLFHLTDSVESLPLANFISLAKNSYGIKNIGVVGETAEFFKKVVTYNSFHKLKATRRINYLNLEFEFWNPRPTCDTGVYCGRYLQAFGKGCNIAAAFEFYQIQLLKTDSIAHANGIKSETYIGNPDSAQCVFISQHVDRVLVHHYRQSDVAKSGRSLYQFKNERYKYLTSFGNRASVMPIFASTDEFMGPWLANNNESTAYNTYLNGIEGYKQEPLAIRSLITMSGYIWYHYSSFSQNYVASNASARKADAERELYFVRNNTVYYNTGAECTIYDTYGNIISAAETTDGDYHAKSLLPGQLYIMQLKNEEGVHSFKLVID